MKKLCSFAAVLTLLVTVGLTTLPKQAVAEEGSAFTIARLVVCKNIVNLEPELGSEETFPLSLGKIYCFLEARKIAADTKINFVWIHEGVTKAKIPLTLRKGWRWRTYSSKKLGNMSGNWTVEIHDENDAVVDSVNFVVQ